MNTMKQSAILAFEDGSVFKGFAFGANKTVCGESVFNTSLAGYQEALTDPSVFGQVLVLTATEIGNVGVNKADEESEGIKAKGLVITSLSPMYNNWRAEKSLDEYMKENDVPGIMSVDTRAIAKKLREKGTLKSCLSTKGISAEEAIKLAQESASIEGQDFVKEVSTKKSYHFDTDKAEIAPFTVVGTNLYKAERKMPLLKCAAIDFGGKRSSFASLAFAGFDITVFPANVSVKEIEKFAPDCVFLSSGAGDPSAVKYAHQTVAELIKKYPTLGIGLGHNILAAALGGKNVKLKTGHRGTNIPVKNIESDVVYITFQNHSFAVDAKSLEKTDAIVTEINLNDNTVEGLRHKTLPVFSVQYYPETVEGPKGASSIFEKFYYLVSKNT